MTQHPNLVLRTLLWIPLSLVAGCLALYGILVVTHLANMSLAERFWALYLPPFAVALLLAFALRIVPGSPGRWVLAVAVPVALLTPTAAFIGGIVLCGLEAQAGGNCVMP